MRSSIAPIALFGAALLTTGCGAFGYSVASMQQRMEADRAAARGDLAAAARSNDAALAYDSRSAGAWVQRVRIANELGQRDAIERDLERAARLDPDDPEVAAHRAAIARDRGDLAGAAAIVERALRHRPDAEELYWIAGVIDLSLDRCESAAARFAAIGERADARAMPAAALPRVYAAIGRGVALSCGGSDAESTNSEAAIASFVKGAQGDWYVALRAASDLIESGQEARLRALSARSAERHPESIFTGMVNAKVQELGGFADAAAAEADRLLLLAPTDEQRVWILIVGAEAELARGSAGNAMARAREALDVQPAMLPALQLLSQAVAANGAREADLAELRDRVGRAADATSDPEQLALLAELARRLQQQRR